MNDLFVHNERLESDYASMKRLTGSVITWQGVPAGNPSQRIYPSIYHVTYNMLAPTTQGDRRQHTIKVDCSALDYPMRAPSAAFLSAPIKHPHVFESGNICLGGFPLEESLAELCIRLARFWQYDPTLINSNSIASRSFYSWYNSNRQRLPLDRSPLPQLQDQVPGGFVVKPQGGMTIKRRSPGNTQNW